MPRWTFEKFPEADETLTTQMKSVGEAMAIGRTFKESFQKVIRSMDVKRFGLGLDKNDKWLQAKQSKDGRTADGQVIEWPIADDTLTRKLSVPSQGRMHFIRYALKMGWGVDKVSSLTGIDPFWIHQFDELVQFEDELAAVDSLDAMSKDLMQRAKQLGYSDAQLANLYLGEISSKTILAVRNKRKEQGVEAIFKCVDTCAAEFEAITPYYYSTYQPGSKRIDEQGNTIDIAPECELRDRLLADENPKQKVIILGGGPNRIGQGIEFDYCCVHAAYAAQELGHDAVMINSNPETVSTDYDTSDLLFFEPLTLEDVLNVTEKLDATILGTIVQFGGQTPLNLAHGLDLAGVPIIGTELDAIDRAEDRDRFDQLLTKLDLKRPASGIARSIDEAVTIAERISYPVLVRPSYVLGGRGMEICPDEKALRHYMATAVDASGLDDAPILIDQFLDGAIELDVDVVADFTHPGGTGVPPVSSSGDAQGQRNTGGTPVPPSQEKQGTALIAAVMEHIEHAGVHSGDSTCMIPTCNLRPAILEEVKDTARKLATELGVCGLMNVQMALKDDQVYIIEVNPRASRTVPYVGKAKSTQWAAIAAKAMMGVSLKEQGTKEIPDTGYYAVKAPVFPFQKFPGVDFVLGPEMRSTGEVMGVDASLPNAYLKAMLGAGTSFPTEGGVFVSVREDDRQEIIPIVRSLMAMGFKVFTTQGTGDLLTKHGLRPKILQKIQEGARPNVIDLMQNNEIQLVINTPTRTGWQTDEGNIRATAVRLGIPMITTATAASQAIHAIEALKAGFWDVTALQDLAEHTPAHERVPV